MRGRVCSAAVAAVLVTTAATAETVRLDLPAAVERVLAENPGLQAVEAQRSEVEGGIREARADAFPQLDAVSYWSRSRNPSLLNSPDFADIIEQFPGATFEPREQELWSAALAVTQTLYSGGQISAAIDLAEVAASIVDARIRAARLDAAEAVAETYYRALAARRALATLAVQRESRQRNLDVVQARLDIGEATRLEQLRASVSLAEVGPVEAARRGDAELAEARLASALALPPDAELVLEATEGEPTSLPELEALVAVALERRPELADLALQIRSYELRQTIERAESKPQVELAGQYGHTSRLPDNLTDSLYADWAVSVNLRWSLFDGGRVDGVLQQLESQQLQARFQLEELRRNVRVGVEEAVVAYRSARARWEAARAAAAAAEEASRVAQENFREGVALQVEVLDAQDQEATAALAAVEAYYDTKIAAAALSRAVGVLPSEPWIAASDPAPPTEPSPGEPTPPVPTGAVR